MHHQLAAPREIEAAALAACLRAFHEGLHQVARVESQPQQLARGRLAGGGVARLHEGHQPAPLGRVGGRTEAHRRIAVQQPARHLRQHAWPGQRRHVAVAQLPAVGKAGLLARALVALQYGDLVAILGQPPCSGHADHPRSHNRYAHRTCLAIHIESMVQSVVHRARLAQCQYVPEYVPRLRMPATRAYP
ncbi:hypothetical protein D3C87_1289010 [compost metagenome]